MLNLIFGLFFFLSEIFLLFFFINTLLIFYSETRPFAGGFYQKRLDYRRKSCYN